MARNKIALQFKQQTTNGYQFKARLPCAIKMAMPISKHQRGYTLIELMITVAIVAIFTTFAVPAFNSFVINNQLVNVVNGVSGGINYARSEAISKGIGVSICAGNASTTAPACSGSNNWANGYLVYTDDNLNGNLDGADQLLRVQSAYSANINIAAGANSITFNNEGFIASGNGDIDFCSEYNDRRLSIGTNGNVRLSGNTPACP